MQYSLLVFIFIPALFEGAVIPFGMKEDLCPLQTNVVLETIQALKNRDDLSKVVDYLRLSEKELVKLLEEVGSRSGKSFTVIH